MKMKIDENDIGVVGVGVLMMAPYDRPLDTEASASVSVAARQMLQWGLLEADPTAPRYVRITMKGYQLLRRLMARHDAD